MTQPDLFTDFPDEVKSDWKSYIDENWIQRCSCCNQKVAIRKRNFDNSILRWWIIMREYCILNNKQTVNIKDVMHAMTKSEYCNVNNLVRFGLAYKNDTMQRGEYWIPRKRWQDFLNGDRKVARYFLQDNTNIEDPRNMSDDRISIHEVPHVKKIMDETNGTFTEYYWNHNFD